MGRIRTYDRVVNSHLLYQLSYTGSMPFIYGLILCLPVECLRAMPYLPVFNCRDFSGTFHFNRVYLSIMCVPLCPLGRIYTKVSDGTHHGDSFPERTGFARTVFYSTSLMTLIDPRRALVVPEPDG